jgi:hypothetical protein
LNTLQFIKKEPCFRALAAGLLLVAGSLAACEETPEAVPAEPQAHVSTCGDKGVLQARLTGAIVAKLDWPDELLHCESMPRPNAEGVRLRFSGTVGEEQLAIIIALPALGAGETGKEFDSNVTISVEGTGRFFSTPGLDTCWSHITVNEPLEDGSNIYNVLGALSCVAPLGELNGGGFVDIQLLRFSGIANWSPT